MVKIKTGRHISMTTALAVFVAILSPHSSATPADPLSFETIDSIPEEMASSDISLDHDEPIYASVIDKPLVRIPIKVSGKQIKPEQALAKKNYLYELTTLINDRVQFYLSAPVKDEQEKLPLKANCRAIN